LLVPHEVGPLDQEMDKQPNIQLITRLDYGEGLIGNDGYGLDNPAEISEVSSQLDSCVVPLSTTKTADCVDARLLIALGNGVTDKEELAKRVTYQLPGGLGLAVTKAAVAADLVILRDAKHLQEAYEIMVPFLDELGYEDAAHAGCGASGNVEASVAKQLPDAALLGTIEAIRP